MIPVLMYHTVGIREAHADAVYHIGRQQFVDQVNIIRDLGIASTTLRDEVDRPTSTIHDAKVILQFDDGAECHATTVMEVLLDAGHVGEFFVNPTNVGRPGYADWEALRAMHVAGMSIQSHGYSHAYLDKLDDGELLDELVRSKKTIEDRIGAPVTVLAAPGGRINRHVATIARKVGYRASCGSRPAYWRQPARKCIVPRIPVRASTSLEALSGFLQCEWQAIAAMQLRYHLLRGAQKVLGNANYERLRKRILPGEPHTDSAHGARKG